jgi:hypothetical protein
LKGKESVIVGDLEREKGEGINDSENLHGKELEKRIRGVIIGKENLERDMPFDDEASMLIGRAEGLEGIPHGFITLGGSDLVAAH